eukprot:23466_1
MIINIGVSQCNSHVAMSRAYFVVLIFLSLHLHAKLDRYPNRIKTDNPLTEKEKAEHQLNSDEQRWFDYKFNPQVPSYDLYHGTEIPTLGFNTKNHNVESLVFALRLGYRFFHTSLASNHYHHIATAMSTVGLRRSSVFLSLAIEPAYYGYQSTINAIKSFAKHVHSEFKNINLCMMDGPQTVSTNDKDTVYQSAKVRRLTWMAMESLKEDGICQNLGVARFEIKHIKELMQFAKWKPTVNKIEFHPQNMRKKLRKYMIQQRIIIIAEDPTGDCTSHYLIQALANKYSKTPSQVLLKWATQQGIVVLPTDHDKQRIADNGQMFGFELDPADLYKINKLNQETTNSEHLQDVETIHWNKTYERRFQLFFNDLYTKRQHEQHELYRQYKEKERIKHEL